MKFCNKCGVDTERQANGRCKPCARLNDASWRKKNTERIAERNADYRAKNPEKVAKLYSEWEEKNQDRIKANSAAYRAANPMQSVRWRAANQDRIKALGVAWRKANPEKNRAKSRNRRALIRGAEGSHTANDVAALLKLQKSKCACCKCDISKKHHVDHIDALVNGGSNDRLNLQLLCPTCNLQKHAKHPVDFMQERGYLL